MDLRDKLDLIGTIKNYLPFGMITVAVIAVIMVVGYFIYRKILKGKKKLSIRKLIWLIIFVCYVLMLGSVTILSRGNSYFGGRYPLFYSYREAWYSFSAQNWRNLILNICMFVPLGFLLPVGIRKMRRFWKTALCGVAVTIVIETLQYLTQRGMFEWDDVLNNTVGAMIGYGLFVIVYAIVMNIRNMRNAFGKTAGQSDSEGQYSSGKNTAISGKYVICCQIPLIAVCVCYALIFGIYQHQELGNLRSQLPNLFRNDELTVSTDQTYATEEQTVPVYQLVQMNREECEAYAADFFEKIGDQLAADETLHYDNTDVFYGESGNTLWLDYIGLTWTYTDFDTTYAEDVEEADTSDSEDEDVDDMSEDESDTSDSGISNSWIDDSNIGDSDVIGSDTGAIKTVTDADEAAIRAALAQYQITVPEGCTFGNEGEGNYSFTASELHEEDHIYDGTIECKYYSNGKMGGISNGMTQGRYYKDFTIISEQEAYEKIVEGKFHVWMFDEDRYNVKVGDDSLTYEQDSKGFYQPVYTFRISINGSGAEISIPAIK